MHLMRHLAIGLLRLLVCLIPLLSGCPGEDGGQVGSPTENPDATAPTATISFPGPTALLTERRVTVRGTARDTSAIAAVQVNGVAATSTDGFATWAASVDLPTGRSVLMVSTEDVVGNRTPAATTAIVTVVDTLSIFSPQAIVVAASGQVFVSGLVIAPGKFDGRAVVRLDPDGGNRILVPIELGPDMALEPTGQLLVLDGQGIIRVDPVTGNSTVVTGPSTGTGPIFALVRNLEVTATGQIYVLDTVPIAQALVRVDPVTGDRAVVSSDTIGSGSPFFAAVGLAIDATGRILVLDAGSLVRFDSVVEPAIVQVDPVSGQRTITPDVPVRCGSACVRFPDNIVPQTTEQILAANDRLEAVVGVNPATGERIAVQVARLGDGPALLTPVDVTIETTGQVLLTDQTLMAVVRVDPDTGTRTIVSNVTTGSGPALQLPSGLVLEATGQALVADTGLSAVVRVDLSTGTRTIVSDATIGSGPALMLPLGLAVAANGQALVTDGGLEALVRIEPGSGNRTIVAPVSTGSRSLFGASRGIAVGSLGQIHVTDVLLRQEINTSVLGPGPTFIPEASVVVRIDPTNGQRTVVSDATVGTGPQLGDLRDIVVDSTGQVLAIDLGKGRFDVVGGFYTNGPVTMKRIDPVSGQRTIVSGPTSSQPSTVVSGPTTGSGTPFSTPVGLAVEATGQILLVDVGLRALLRVDVQSGDRAIISR